MYLRLYFRGGNLRELLFILSLYVLFLLILLLGFDKAFISFPVTIIISVNNWTLVNENQLLFANIFYSVLTLTYTVRWFCLSSSFFDFFTTLEVMFSYFTKIFQNIDFHTEQTLHTVALPISTLLCSKCINYYYILSNIFLFFGVTLIFFNIFSYFS